MCTGARFSNKDGKMYFGRNLDWSETYGQKVVVTPKNYKYNSAFLGEMPVKYPLIGMAIVMDNVPLYFDCGNTAGLAIAGLNFPGYAQYEKSPVDGKTNIAVYEFPLWVAMNFSSVDEVEKALKEVALVDKPFNENTPTSFLHWIIGDDKRSIVVEYTENGMEIFDNKVDVLTNQPGYKWHEENLRNYMNLSSVAPEKVEWNREELKPFGSGSMMRGIPGDYYSTSRFVRVAYFNANYPVQDNEKDNVLRMFHTLAGVAMIDGAAAMTDGKFEKTIYTSCFSSVTNTYYYSTYENPGIQTVSLKDCDPEGSELVVR